MLEVSEGIPEEVLNAVSSGAGEQMDAGYRAWIPGQARPFSRRTSHTITKRGVSIVRNYMVPGSAEWKRAARKILKATPGQMYLMDPVWLEVHVFRAKAKGRSCNMRYPTVRPDATNLLKLIEDALIGVAFLDDSQVVAQHTYKRYHKDVIEGVYVAVGPMGEVYDGTDGTGFVRR